MKKFLITVAALAFSAGMASANTTIGATVNSGSGGIMNNATTVYHGASLSSAGESAVNSASNVQGGFLNNFQAAQAGDSANLNAQEIEVSAPVAVIKAKDGGNINMSKMFQLMNTTNSIGD